MVAARDILKEPSPIHPVTFPFLKASCPDNGKWQQGHAGGSSELQHHPGRLTRDTSRFRPGGDTFADTFVRASCVTNPATRVQDARSEMRNFRKPVGSRCKMRGGREHLAHPRRALGAGGPGFKSRRRSRAFLRRASPERFPASLALSLSNTMFYLVPPDARRCRLH